MDPKKIPPANRAKVPAVTPAELAHAIQLFKWGVEDMRKLSQRVDRLENSVRQMAHDGVHRDALRELEREVAKLRDEVRRGQLAGEGNLISGTEKDGEAKNGMI